MSPERLLIIGAGTVAMLAVMLLRRRRYPGVALWKMPIVSILLTVCGVLGAMLLYFVENGRFGGTSFFGAILLVPLLMLPVLLLRIPYGTLMDLCAPAECAMLAVLKLDCLQSGCCGGMVLGDWGGREVRFPSQIVELIASLAIMLVLLARERKPESRNKLYPFYLILYGAVRFALNWFRDNTDPFVWLLPPGNYWALISIAVGLIWLYFTKRKIVSENIEQSA